MTGCVRVATVLLVFVASCDTNQSCAHVFCDSGGVLQVASFSEADFARLTGAQINVCFNGWCNQGVIDALPDPNGIHTIGLGVSTDPSVKLSLQRFDPSSTIQVVVDIESGRQDLFQDGDVYALDLVGMDGEQLVHTSWSVDYGDSEPNGEGCGTCRMADSMTQL